jgi:CPA2 family monovalent cation:H+ antiporter-2
VLPLAVLVLTPILIFVLRKYIARLYTHVEKRFLQNLNARELAELEKLEELPQIAPWDAVLAQLVLSSDSPIAGQSFEESKFRSITGATVAMIDRGRRRIFAPSRSERLLPNDELFLIGTDEQIAAARKLIQPEAPDVTVAHDELFSLESVLISEDSPYARKSIRELGIGEQFGGMIVGIERRDQRLLNPESATIIEPGDVIWVFGHRDRIRRLSQDYQRS